MNELSDNWENDPVITAISKVEYTPKNVLEIGCSFGWRLNRLRERYGCQCSGIDPSFDAVTQGIQEFPSLNLTTGFAEDLPYSEKEFDLVVFGWCLYTCAREHLFKIAYHADRVLSGSGLLIVYDFCPIIPQTRCSVDFPPVSTYKMDYGTMFSWHPNYDIVLENIFCDKEHPERETRMHVVIFRKADETKTGTPETAPTTKEN